MLTEKELLDLNIQGFLPGPKEDVKPFLQRVKLTKQLIEDPEQLLKEQKQILFSTKDRVKKPALNWANTSLMHLYGFYVERLPAYFCNRRLSFFEGAATFLINVQNYELPLLQLRKELQKGSFSFYRLDEILAHEMVHFLRASFAEKQFEEHFAYLTSKHILRRVFGPLAASSKEVFSFLTLLFMSLGLEIGFLLFQEFWLKSLFFISLASLMSFFALGLFRLFKTRKIFAGCLRKLKRVLKDKALPCMVRLTDEEICLLSKMKESNIETYALSQKDTSLRWQVIYAAYFA